MRKITESRVISALLGISWLLLGVGLIYNPIFCGGQFDYCMDLSAYNIPLGIGLMLVGAGIALVALFKRKDSQTLICPSCEYVFIKNVSDKKCPSCNVDLEPLEGFYERHPERKDEGRKQ